MSMVSSLAIHHAQFPFCWEATQQIRKKRGAAHRISTRGVMYALALGYGPLYDLMRRQIKLLVEKRGVVTVDLYAPDEQRDKPWEVHGRRVFTASELLEVVQENLTEVFGVETTTNLLAVPEEEDCTEDVVFGCVDGDYFEAMSDFIAERFEGGKVHQFYWAGSATSRFAPFEVHDLAAQITASNAHRVHVVQHRNCLGHGGEERLGDLQAQQNYYEQMVNEPSAFQQTLQLVLPTREFYFYFATGGEAGVIDLGRWEPLRSA